ncbi:hypothetical protein [Streptomyces filamentosus]
MTSSVGEVASMPTGAGPGSMVHADLLFGAYGSFTTSDAAVSC